MNGGDWSPVKLFKRDFCVTIPMGVIHCSGLQFLKLEHFGLNWLARDIGKMESACLTTTVDTY